jgi:hypothetical protein
MTDPVLELNSSPDSFINKSVHTSDGVLIGNIHAIDKDSVVVKKRRCNYNLLPCPEAEA